MIPLPIFCLGLAATLAMVLAVWAQPVRSADTPLCIGYAIACGTVVLLVWVGTRSLWKQAKGQYRLAIGQCPRCGYDLRASKERCPECGTPIPGDLATTPGER